MDPKTVPTVPLFSSTSRRDRQTIARLADVVTVPEGTVLIREGATADAFYVIVDGVAEVSRAGAHVASLGPGDHFGEIGLLERIPRTATVTAATSLELVVLARREFRSLISAIGLVGRRVQETAEERSDGTLSLAA
ncbi:MAG: cyclic nucleotide-binding domain-containing protein [Gaiella sp.]